MFENYLIEPDAIAALINGEDNRDMPVTNSEVEEWLRENGSSDKFFAAKSGVAYSDPAWHELVHGAELLKSLLYSLTECRVRYDKVRHGEVLTRYIVRKPSPAVIDLAELVADLCVQ